MRKAIPGKEGTIVIVTMRGGHTENTMAGESGPPDIDPQAVGAKYSPRATAYPQTQNEK
jgi:hypothetical protein